MNAKALASESGSCFYVCCDETFLIFLIEII